MYTKKSLRETLIEKRYSLPYEVVQKLSKQICDNLVKHQIFKASKVIAFYMPIRSEVDLSNAMLCAFNRNKKVCLPVINSGKMIFREYKNENDLKLGKFDILEPAGGDDLSNEIDLILIPLVAFDIDGFRLGYGGGFYDRFLENREIQTVGVAYDFQQVQSILPERHDMRLDLVVLCDKVIKFT